MYRKNTQPCGAILFCILYIALLTACHTLPKARPISEYKLISVMGLDKREGDPGGVALTLSAKEQAGSKLGGGKQGGGAAGGRPLLLTNEARSVALAYQEMQTYTQDYLFLGHIRYFLLGEDAAREGVARYLDYPARDPDGRFLARLYVVEGASARDVLSRASTNENYVADRLNAMESDVGVMSVSNAKNLTQTLNALYGANGNFLLPLIRMVPPAAHDASAELEKEESESKDKDKDKEKSESEEKDLPDQKGTAQEESSSDKGAPDGPSSMPMELDIAGYAILVDGCMAGVIGTDLSPAVNFLQNTVNSYTAEVPGGGHMAALRILNGHSELTPLWDGGRLTGLNIEIQVEAALNERQSGRLPDDPKGLKPLAGQFDRWLETALMSVLTRAQGLGADYLGIGARLNRMHPVRFSRLESDWDQIFTALPISARVETTVVRSYELD